MRVLRIWLGRMALLGAAWLGASLAYAAFPLEVQQGNNRLTFTETPKRVAVLDLGVLDTLDALGVEVVGMPQITGPHYLKQAYRGREGVVVGTLFEPDYAALEALQPDLIIVGRRSAPAQEKLSELAPTLNLYAAPDRFLEQTYEHLQLLGKLFDRQEQAARLERELKQAVAEVHGKTAGASALTLFTINQHLIVQAPGDRHGMLYQVLGLEPVVASVKPEAEEKPRPAPDSKEAQEMREQQQALLQGALERQPDWLIVLDRGAATGGEGKGEETLGAHPLVSAGAAWQAERVFYLEPATWYIATGGYQGLMSTLQAFAARF
ncbi:siderophore ABC transporter substrate-binding protein [Pseudomonas sp. NCCP-436]|uniref:siderophore ABC transporter substrate-binding protein n=1 Tax=Pseudomonas sp. NCCP-436 TaxID=2842481 RepID=UPI001C80CB9E|nr:ABC transporter substrate-binding protein [Pseudomonas sp. NCCP-436]